VSISASGSSTRTAITTSGRVPNGGIIEREIMTQIGDQNGFDLILNNRTDFTMASRVAKVVASYGAAAFPVDGSTVHVTFPEQYVADRVDYISQIENLEVESTTDVAKVVVNERTGTVVIGNTVRLLPAAVAHGGITVTVSATNSVSQPGAPALLGNSGQTVGVTNSQINIDTKHGSLIKLNANSSLSDLVSALNALGATPTDLISILQALKAAGSLEATLEII
jgi:flagellar P-ring protein precursor FlgI